MFLTDHPNFQYAGGPVASHSGHQNKSPVRYIIDMAVVVAIEIYILCRRQPTIPATLTAAKLIPGHVS